MLSANMDTTEFRVGAFVAPAIGLDFIGNEYYPILVHGFENDLFPLFGIQLMKTKKFVSHSTRLGVEPIVKLKNYSGFTFDFRYQFMIGCKNIKISPGLGYKFRTIDKFTLRQHYVYSNLSCFFLIKNTVAIEPGYFFGLNYESTHHPDLSYYNGDGRYLQDWFEINVVYFFK